MKKIIIILLILAVMAVAAYFVFRLISTEETQAIQTTDVAGPALVVSTLRQTGVIKPQVGAMMSVGARATGTLEQVNVKVGDHVEQGQLVAKIDSRSIRQSIRQSEDQLSKAKVDFEKTKSLYPVQRSMQQNTLTTSQSNYDYTKSIYEREVTLYEKGYTRKETLDKANHDLVSAQSDLERQRLQLNLIDTEYRSNLTTLQTEINRLESVIADQNIQLGYTEIYAPISGTVSAISAIEGEIVMASSDVAKLVTIFRPELLEMYVYVDESDIGKVLEDMKVYYTVDTYPDRNYEGTIARINPQSETRDGVIYYVAIVNMSEEDALTLRPEMTTTVRIVAQEKNTPVTVANNAIKWEDGSQIVYKVLDKANNLTERIPIRVGLRGESRTEILSGVAAGDETVVRFGVAAPSSGAGGLLSAGGPRPMGGGGND